MPKSRRRKISNYRRIQSRNRRRLLDAKIAERARAKEEAKAAAEPEVVETSAAEPEALPSVRSTESVSVRAG